MQELWYLLLKAKVAKLFDGAYGVVVTQRSVDPLSPVRIRLGTHERKTRTAPRFSIHG